jgi:purine-binding chemotaxis protein CheW
MSFGAEIAALDRTLRTQYFKENIMEETYTTSTDEEQEKDRLLQLVGFVIGNEQFGVNILMVQEIIRSTPITAVPNSPDFIEGVINLRGSIIPVIELRKRLNLYDLEKDSDEDTWIIILDVEGRVTGFIVDSVTEVIKIEESTIEPPPEIVVAGLKSQYIRGVCKLEKRLLILLDFNRILLLDEIKKLKEIGEEA